MSIQTFVGNFLLRNLYDFDCIVEKKQKSVNVKSLCFFITSGVKYRE